MKRTGIPQLIGIAVLAGVVGAIVQLWVSASGRASLVPPIGLGAAFAAGGIVVVALAWPIRRALRTTKTAAVDADYGLRVVSLAKACGFAGAAFVGFFIGTTVPLLTRPVVPGALVADSVVVVIGSLLLVVGALVAERFCMLPPDDEGRGGIDELPDDGVGTTEH